MKHCRYSCYNILSFTQRWMPLCHCHFGCECLYVPRAENDDMPYPPPSNDNIWNPGHREAGQKRLSSWQTLSVSCCHLERAKCQDVWCLVHAIRYRPLCAWQLPVLPISLGGVGRQEVVLFEESRLCTSTEHQMKWLYAWDTTMNIPEWTSKTVLVLASGLI